MLFVNPVKIELETSILDAFNDYFEMIPANTVELKQEVYKLRYQVYCVENNIAKPHSGGLECDEYDVRSSHYLIRHRDTDCYMATTRLVLPDKQNLQELFPIEVNSHIDNMALVRTMSRANLAELSRFCVSKQFRRRVTDRDNGANKNSCSPREKDSSAHLTLALFACAIKMSAEHNIHYWYGIIDPALKRAVAALGIHVIEIGPLVDYHGMRLPCAIKVDDLLQGVAEKNLDYWKLLTNNGRF